MLDRLRSAHSGTVPDDSVATATAAIMAESWLQLGRARRMIADSRRLRVRTEAAIAASRRALDEASRVLAR